MFIEGRHSHFMPLSYIKQIIDFHSLRCRAGKIPVFNSGNSEEGGIIAVNLL